MPPGQSADDHELHAAEIRHPKRAHSVWVDTDGQLRRRMLEEALDVLGRFRSGAPTGRFAPSP